MEAVTGNTGSLTPIGIISHNGYDNLVSADYKDYTGYLDKYAIEAMGENRRYIDSIEQSDELAALFDELENTEN